jgi:hypothetical protein
MKQSLPVSPRTLVLRLAERSTAMKFRWSEWLAAAALVFAFSAFAAEEAAESPVVTAETR